MSERPSGTSPAASLAAQDRRLLVALLGVLVVVFALVGSNVAANHAPKPHHVPTGVIGPPSVVRTVAGSLDQQAPGAYQVHAYSSLAAGKTAILDRTVYAAIRPLPSPLLLVASAASPSVASLLEQVAGAAARARGQSLAVDDLVPLPSSDSRGATAFSMTLGLIFAGVMGSAVIYLLDRHRTQLERLATAVALGIGVGLVAALVTNVVVGAFKGHFLAGWGVSTLFYLALAVPIAAFQVLVGAGGVAIGAVMFLVIGNPASGGSSAPELLPGFWRDLSQLLPPGAATTAIRDVVYFHGHGMTAAILVLSLWVVIGAAVAIIVNTMRTRGRAAAAHS
jgi:hypothetical protein